LPWVCLHDPFPHINPIKVRIGGICLEEKKKEREEGEKENKN
jgi:hypothetical protein